MNIEGFIETGIREHEKVLRTLDNSEPEDMFLDWILKEHSQEDG